MRRGVAKSAVAGRVMIMAVALATVAPPAVSQSESYDFDGTCIFTPNPCWEETFADLDECVSYCGLWCEETEQDISCEDASSACDDAAEDCTDECLFCAYPLPIEDDDPDAPVTVEDVCEDIDYCFELDDYLDPGELSDWGPKSFDYPWDSSTGPVPDHTAAFSDAAGWMTYADPQVDPQSVFAAYLLPSLFQPVEEPARPAALPAAPPTAGDPVELLSGAQVMTVTDLRFQGPARDLTFSRSYASRSDDRSVLGSNWTFEYDVFLERVTPTSRHPWTPSRCRQPGSDLDCRVLHDAGRRTLYVRGPDELVWLSPTTGAAALHIQDGTLTERFPNGRERRFDA